MTGASPSVSSVGSGSDLGRTNPVGNQPGTSPKPGDVWPTLPLGTKNAPAPNVPGPFGADIGAMLNTPFWRKQYAKNPSGTESAFSPQALNALSIFFPGMAGS